MTRHLQKWHGAGNDFLVDVMDHGPALWWTPERAQAVCDRRTGVGADGLLVADVAGPVTMTLFNADGSLAEMSGNGIRCLAAGVRRATAAKWDEIEITTAAGLRTVTLAMVGNAGRGSVAMGRISALGPIPGALQVVSVGNPHVVVLDKTEWDDTTRERLAAEWSHAVGGANVEFIRPEGPNRLVLRVIERGVGWTLACGTGSCASAFAARSAGLVGDDVTVENPGGTLTVRLSGDDATLEGPVQFVADVEWAEE